MFFLPQYRGMQVAALHAGSGVATDPHFASVVLLTAFDGEDGATVATDDSNSAHTLTFAGNAQIDTASSKFGGASLLCDGTGDWINITDHANWQLDGEFTIEAWVRPNHGSAATSTIVGQWTNINPNCNFHLSYNFGSATAKRFQFTMDADGNPTGQVSITPLQEDIDQSVFHHVAVDRDSGDTIRLYLDGVMKGSATLSGGPNVSGNLRIGDRGTGTAPFNGWIDEIRITKGVARYANDGGFTPPTTAFPRS